MDGRGSTHPQRGKSAKRGVPGWRRLVLINDRHSTLISVVADLPRDQGSFKFRLNGSSHAETDILSQHIGVETERGRGGQIVMTFWRMCVMVRGLN
jgi:hypothetical protein